MSISSGITTSTWRLGGILNFVKKRMFRSRETLGLFTCDKGGHSEPEHFLKFSASYIFFPFQKNRWPKSGIIRQVNTKFNAHWTSSWLRPMFVQKLKLILQ